MKFAEPKIKATLGLDYVFTFGKHKDLSIQDVIETDPSYIIWCADSINWFDLDTVVYDMAHEKRMTELDHEIESKLRRENNWGQDYPDWLS